MTTHVTALNSTSSNFGVDVVYAVQQDVFFSRDASPPAKNGTAIVSGIVIGRSNATSSVTLLTIEDNEMSRQVQANAGLISLINKWISNDPKEPDSDLEQQKRDFDKDRESSRRLF
jgi:hypothetical protein